MTDVMNGTLSREDLVGGATGAIVMALFGGIWALGCTSVFEGALAPILFASSVAVTGILLVASLSLRRAAHRLPRRRLEPAKAHRIRRRFRLVNIGQGLSIGIVVFAGVLFGHPEWVPAAIVLIVGLHFFPLATLFRAPLYYATGAALCLASGATPILATLSGVAAAWQVVPGLGAAIVLWTTSAVAVTIGLVSSRRVA